MTGPTKALAAFAAALRYENLPAEVVLRAKQCVIDTVAAARYGAELPWSRMIAAQARRSSAGGSCRIFDGGPAVHAGAAALANGSAAHAFEMDSLVRPSVGVHPGATLVPPLLAVAQERGASGRDVITALVAGCEVLCRIGAATRHSAEHRGFHAPGLTGPLGGAAAVGRLAGLDAGQITNAMGVAGSLAGGLLEFAAAGNGGMVKRLHLGRAAEAGVLAAALAADGFTGPSTVLEGRFGFLAVFCEESEPERLTRALGKDWETLKICFKRYPCHITAHTPVEAALALQREHDLDAGEIAAIEVIGSAKMAAVHNIPVPPDQILAQYSIPWCVAAALVGEPDDPECFGPAAFADPRVAALSAAGKVEAGAPAHLSNWGTVVTLRLRDGRSVTAEADDFSGTPGRPFSEVDLQRKFTALVGAGGDHAFRRLWRLEEEKDLAWVGAGEPL